MHRAATGARGRTMRRATARRCCGSTAEDGLCTARRRRMLPRGMPGHRWRIAIATLSLSAAGAGVAAVALAQPTEMAPPSISGKAVFGATLRCDPGSWTGAVRFAYTWNNGGQVLGTAQTLQVPAGAIDY